MANLLVTGYGGFLGKEICRQLLANGHRVRGLARKHYPALVERGVEAIVGDASQFEVCWNATEGMDAILHVASVAGVWGPRKIYESINVDSTKWLLDSAKKRGMKAFVYCSSPSVTFDGKDQSGIDESVPYPTKWLCDYPRTKALAEQLVIASNQADGLLTCSLRPHLIWGKEDPHLIPRLREKCVQGKLICVGTGRNLIDTVHVESAARAHVLALQKLLDKRIEVSGRSYFITDGQPIACWDWISQLLRQFDLKPPKKKIPFSLAYTMGYAMEVLYRAAGKQQEPPLTRFVAAQLGKEHYFSIESAKQLLGYNPSIDRDQRLSELS